MGRLVVAQDDTRILYNVEITWGLDTKNTRLKRLNIDMFR